VPRTGKVVKLSTLGLLWLKQYATFDPVI